MVPALVVLSLQLKTQMADMGQHRTGEGAGVTLVQPEAASPEMGPEHQRLSIHEREPGRADQTEGAGREDGWDPARCWVASRNPRALWCMAGPSACVGRWTEHSQSGQQ